MWPPAHPVGSTLRSARVGVVTGSYAGARRRHRGGPPMKLHDRIDERLRAFIEAQHLFFVATAPLASDGHVNLSPKGLDGTFAVLGEHEVAYLDLTGSGSETAAHLRENGRVTVMFCAFEGPPNIVRLHGTGRYVALGESEFDSYRGLFATTPGHGESSSSTSNASRTRAA